MTFADWCVEHARTSGRQHNHITLDDKLAFFQQLSTMVSSGTPLLQALQICSQQTSSRKLRDILEETAERVASGSSLHEAVAQYPDHFEHHWIEVIRTGEVTGKLNLVLCELVKRVAEARAARRKVFGAMMYPIVLTCVAAAAMTVLLWFVVPTFKQMFDEMGADLPGVTQVVVDASDFLVSYGVYVTIALGALVFGTRRYMRTEAGRRLLGTVGVATPLVGELMVSSAMYRFASTISLLLNSGVPLLDALGILRGVFAKSPIYRDAISQTEAGVAAGRTLADSLDESILFTSMVVNMVRVGEESATLGGVMDQVAPFYREKTEAMMSKAMKLMEPAIIIAMGVALSAMMLAIYLPMFEMAGNVN